MLSCCIALSLVLVTVNAGFLFENTKHYGSPIWFGKSSFEEAPIIDRQEKVMGTKSSLRVGIIGKTVEEMRNIPYRKPNMTQACYWYGTGPVCMGECPEGLTEMRTASEVRRYRWRFGADCWSGTKSLCCRRGDDDSWQGHYLSGRTGAVYECYWNFIEYDTDKNNYGSVKGIKLRCGRLRCVAFHGVPDHLSTLKSVIGGSSCNTIEMMGLKGIANAEQIEWYPQNELSDGQPKDIWYKSNYGIYAD